MNTIAIMLKLKYNFNLLAVKFIRKNDNKKNNIKNKLIFNVKITKLKLIFDFNLVLGWAARSKNYQIKRITNNCGLLNKLVNNFKPQQLMNLVTHTHTNIHYTRTLT